VTADHGHVPLGAGLSYGALRARLPWLPQRAARVGNGLGVPAPGSLEEAVRTEAETLYGQAVTVHRVADLWADGLWGAGGDPRYQSRVGDLLLWAEGPGSSWLPEDESRPRHPWGHGGTTDAEMRVPWIQLRP
jgi:hypothetical protein